MSLFKSRSGGSMFRSRNLSGYRKVLFEKQEDDEHTVGSLSNKMMAKYQVSDSEQQ